MQEHDTVVLTRSLPEHGLVEGDVGAIVHNYGKSDGGNQTAFEVEFVDAAGGTIALLTLEPADIRPRRTREILHVRELTR